MGVIHDVKRKLKLVTSLLPKARTADENGDGVDTLDSKGVMLVAHIGAPGITLGGSDYIAFEVEHCDDNSTWVDCADADIDGAVSGANTGTFAKADADAEASMMYKANYIGSKRYVRIVENRVGTHGTATPTAAHVVLDSIAQPQS